MRRQSRSAGLLVLLLVTLVSVAVLAGCGGDTTTTTAGGTDNTGDTSATTAPAQPVDKSIVIALPGEPTSLDAMMKEDGNMRAVTNQIYEPLIDLDGATMKPIPLLAKEWTQTDPTTWRLTLQQGVKFHDGADFTADDVVATITKEVDPANKSELNGYFASLKSATKVDDFTVDIVTGGPAPNTPTILSFLPIEDADFLGSHTPEQLATVTNGTGPYMLDGEWKKGVSIALKAFDGYWGTKPDVTNVQYKFLEENQTRLASLLTGESDLIIAVLPEYVQQIEDKGMKITTANGIEFPLIRFKTTGGPMVKVEMRLAANYAIDREAIIDGIYGGYAAPATQPLKAGMGGYNPDIQGFPYDPQKAKDLLKAAGYNNEPIELVGEGGRWLKDKECATAVADMLRAVGMNIDLQITGWQDWLDKILNRDKAPDIIWVSAGDDIFDASRPLDSFISTKGSLSAFGNAEYDALIAASEQAPTQAEREKLQQEIIKKVVVDDPYAAVLANAMDVDGLSARIDYQAREDGKVNVAAIKVIQ